MTISSDLLLGAHFDSALELDYVRDGGARPVSYSAGPSVIVAGGKFGNCVELGNPAAPESLEWYGADYLPGLAQTGCISLWIKTGFSGLPPAIQYFFQSQQISTSINRVELYLNSAGGLRFYVRSSTGGTISSVLGAWAPVAATWYHFEANFDVTTGETRLFIDGTQFGATHVGTGTRSGTTSAVYIGNNGGSPPNNDFAVDELLVFDAVQHTANFVPPVAPVDLTYSVLANLSFESVGSEGGVDSVDWPDVWSASCAAAEYDAGVFGSPSRWVESFDGRWSSNEDAISAFVPATHLTQGVFDVWPYERIYEGFERDWSANEGVLASLTTGDVTAGAFDAAADAAEDFEQEWSSRHVVADVASVITETFPSISSLPELIIRLNEIKATWNLHIASAVFHTAADLANAITAPDAIDLSTAIDLAEEIWNNRIWDHIVDGALAWHLSGSPASLIKPTKATLAIISDQSEAWEVAISATIACNLHFAWASCSGLGYLSAFEDFTLTPTSIYAVVFPHVGAETFESDWSLNETSLTAFAPADITAGDFVTNGAPNQYEGFEVPLELDIPHASTTAGAALSIDPTDGVRVAFGGTLTGSMRLEVRRRSYGSWLTISDVDTLPVSVDVEAGFKQLRVYTVAYSAGTPTAGQHFRGLDTL